MTSVVRAWWFCVGCLAVGVGAIGIVVPVLPTTVFFVVAAWCFGRSSPRFEQWVLGLPRIGPLVADYRAGLGMSRRAKTFAIGTMWVAIGLSALALRDRVWIVTAVFAAGVVGTAYLCWRVPTRRRDVSTGDGPA
jgi:uncharacterized membrane protein YbaN (DUF454 family)